MRLFKYALGFIWIIGIWTILLLPIVIHWFILVTILSVPIIVSYGDEINDWLTKDF